MNKNNYELTAQIVCNNINVSSALYFKKNEAKRTD